MNNLRYLALMLLSMFIFDSCSDNGTVNTNSNQPLLILQKSPEVGTELLSKDSLLTIKFNNSIELVNSSIRIMDYNSDTLIEKISREKIVVKDSTIQFKITKKLIQNALYYVIFDSGTLFYTNEKYLYRGFDGKSVMNFVYKGIDLNVLETFPANGDKLFEMVKPFTIKFDKPITPGNLDIKIISFTTGNLIYQYKPDEITFNESSLTLKIPKLPDASPVSIIIAKGAVRFNNDTYEFSGFDLRTDWSFTTPKKIPANSIFNADINGNYKYNFNVQGKDNFTFEYFPGEERFLITAVSTLKNHKIILSFKKDNSKTNIYSLVSVDGNPSMLYVSDTESYISNENGAIKVLADNDKFIQAEFHFSARLKDTDKYINIPNGTFTYLK